MNPGATHVRLLIADDHAVVREGIAALMQQQGDFRVVAQASSGSEAVMLWREHKPDVTLMDLRMPGMDGVDAITQIRSTNPAANIVILTTYDGDEDIYRGLRAGARGYLLKDARPEELVTCIRSVHSGRAYIPNEVAAKLAGRIGGDALTERERGILQYVAKGESNKRIALDLGITEGTVKTHLQSILAKLDATSRTEAVAIAHKRGLIKL